ncbi:MAG: hypothetical protein HND57_04615 [Planctomycetes bacterium]|nr:hypothetical protein [Planctomycetota bacterium]
MDTTAPPTSSPAHVLSPDAPPTTALDDIPRPDLLHQPSASDLADVMAAFTAATERLQQAHTTLQAEVARLKGELRETNAKLRRSRELAALGQMAAGIAHEVRNPLGSIRLFASMLAEDLEPEQPESGTLAHRIVQAVDDLDLFVTDVLTFSKEIKVRPDQVDPLRILRDAVATCMPLCHETIDIEIDQAASVDALCQLTECADFVADPTLLQQALVNMIRNGLEAVEDSDGRVLCRLCYGVTSPDEWNEAGEPTTDRGHGAGDGVPTITFEIQDNGVGLSDDCLDSMYNPFFTTKAAGTGLGLSIAHKIVEAHGGELEIGNNDDTPGTTARIRLRCIPTADTTATPHHHGSTLIREEVCE